MVSPPDDFGSLEFETVVQWCLPAFPLVKNKISLPAIKIAIISVLANSIKRQGEVSWNEPLPQKMERWNLLRGKETYDDLRLNLIIVGDAGSGKTGLMKGIANLNPFKSVFIQSSPQYDQMIGSTLTWQENKKWKYEPMPGQLSADIFLMDEALSVYKKDAPDVRIRELLRAAMSRIGTNMINKPLVKVPEQYQCNYYPELTLIQGFPAAKGVPVSLISEGDVRRAQIVCVNFPLSEKEKTHRFGMDFPEEKPPTPADYEIARKLMAYLRGKKFKFWVPPSTEAFVKDAMSNLKVFTASYGLKASWYFKIAFFDLESQILRYAAVMSVLRDSRRDVIEITIDDVKNGWKYFASAYADSLLWLNNYTVGDWAVGAMKEAELEKTTVVVEWLEGMGAFTPDSTLTVDSFKAYLAEKNWFATPQGFKRFWDGLLERGYIRSGRHGSSWNVWLGPKGQEMLNEGGVETPW